VGPANEKARRP